MEKGKKKKKIFSQENGLQDFIFLGGIFVFSAVLIIGLFPEGHPDFYEGKYYFIFAIGTVPVIAAIYFIIVSFRQNFYLKTPDISTSIRYKMALAFVFVSMLPTLIIVLVSNTYINRTFDKLISDKTSTAFKEAISMASEPVYSINNLINGELSSLEFSFSNRLLFPMDKNGRQKINRICQLKGLYSGFYFLNNNSVRKFRLLNITNVQSEYNLKLLDFVKTVQFKTSIRLDRVGIMGDDLVVGILKYGNFLITVYKKIPKIVQKRNGMFNNSFADYKRLEGIRTGFLGNASVFFLIISICVIMISVLISLYLSKSISKPVLELAHAAKEFASGNSHVKMEISSEDELGILFSSFNQMVTDIENNRKVMYQKQRLEAWREMARRVVHEIKNPLTPIRLSAERMRKRFIEKHPNLDEIIMTGTDTIIEEVESLKNLLSEFTEFARLPEMKPKKSDLNELLENCVSFFSGHENVEFEVNLDENIPEIMGDKILLRQAVSNLLLNAIQSLNEHGKITIITQYCNEYKETVRIKIIDNGPGIKKENLHRIFEPGFSTKKSGTGLGLAIVEKIIIEHNGRLFCNSILGSGTEFIIEFPVYSNEV